MGRQTFPNFSLQPGALLTTFRIDGSAVGATAGSDGLSGRGKFLCTISKSSNVVTINWTPGWADAPAVTFQTAAGQTNTLVEIVSETSEQLVYQTVESDDNTTGVNDADLLVNVVGYTSTAFVS